MNIHPEDILDNINNNDDDPCSQHILAQAYIDNGNIKKAIEYYEKAAMQDHVESLLELGLLYIYGNYIDRDTKKGFDLLRRASSKGFSKAQYTLSLLLTDVKYSNLIDFEEAIKWLVILAGKEDPDAQNRLGLMYANSINPYKNLDKAIFWFNKSINNKKNTNITISLNNIGSIYLYDLKDYSKALECFTKSAALGNIDALYELGRYYALNDNNIQANYKKSHEYFQMAVDKNHILAKLTLGLAYMFDKIDGINENRKYGFDLIYQAASSGEPCAQFLIGTFYRTGNIVDINHHEALRWLTLSAQQNYPDALYELGAYYLLVDKEGNKIQYALTLLEKASDENSMLAQHLLGECYLVGKHVEINHDNAIKYFTLAAKQNNAESQFNLGCLYMDENSKNYDIHESIKWFTLSSDHGHMESQFNLGLLYYMGNQIEKNNMLAYKFFMMSSIQGCSDAEKYLKILRKDFN